MESYVLRVVFGASLNIGLLVPFFALAFLATPGAGKSAVKPVLLWGAFLTLDIALVWLFQVVSVIPAWGHLNWQGKLLELTWPLLLAAWVPACSAERIGLRWPPERRAWRILPVLSALYALIMIPFLLHVAHWRPEFGTRLPAYAYEGTMPGLAEEFVYRGVLLMLLDQAFGRPWKIAGAQLGWGFVIVTAMFGLLHGIDATPGKVHIYWSAMIYPVVIGAVLAWLRERTDSVWPGVVLHNVVNLVNTMFV